MLTPIHDAILAERARAARDGVTINTAEEPRDTFLAGYLTALTVAAQLATNPTDPQEVTP